MSERSQGQLSNILSKAASLRSGSFLFGEGNRGLKGPAELSNPLGIASTLDYRASLAIAFPIVAPAGYVAAYCSIFCPDIDPSKTFPPEHRETRAADTTFVCKQSHVNVNLLHTRCVKHYRFDTPYLMRHGSRSLQRDIGLRHNRYARD